MTNLDLRQIYDRHHGPFWLMLTRLKTNGKGKQTQTNDYAGLERYGADEEHVRGTFTAEEAHEEARMLVNDKRDDVVDAFVFSSNEGQFIGALYVRGVDYPAWADMGAAYGRSALPAESTPAAQRGRDADAPQYGVEAPDREEAPAAAPKRTRDRQPGSPTARRARLGVAAAKIETWPKSVGAQIIYRAMLELGEAGITAVDLSQKVALDCAKEGIAFPASLVSRLKQGGFLKEIE